jgi:hypothetical protein
MSAQSIDIIGPSRGYENAHCLPYALADLPSTWWKTKGGIKMLKLKHLAHHSDTSESKAR